MSPTRGRLLLASVAAALLAPLAALAEAPANALPAGALARLGTSRFRQPYQRSPAVFVILSGDGKTLASRSDDRTVRLWDAVSGQLLKQIDEAEALTAFAFSADGKTLATASSGTVRLYEVADAKPLRQWLAHEASVASLCFTPDGKGLVTGSPDQSVILWDPATGKETRKLGADLDAIASVTVSSDGKTIAAGGRRSTVWLWDAASGKELRPLTGDGSRLFAIAFAPDGKTLALGARTTTRLFDVAEGKELRQFGHALTDEVTSHNNDETLAFSADGSRLVTGGKSIRVWETETGKQVCAGGEGRKRVTSVAFSADGKAVIAGGGDQEIRFWDAATGKRTRAGDGHQDRVQCVAFAPDGKSVVTGGADRNLFLWDSTTGKVNRPLTGHEAGITAVTFSPDGKRVASADAAGMLRVWDAATGKEENLIQAHSSGVNGLAFSPNGKALASAGRDGKLRLYEIAKEREIHEFPVHANGVTALAFSADGNLLASATGTGQLRVWKMRFGDEILVDAPMDDLPLIDRGFRPAAPPQAGDPLLLLAFTPDGKELVSWLESGAIVAWEVATRKQKAKFDGPAAQGSQAAFSPDRKLLATRDNNNRVLLRETATGQERLVLPGHPGHDFIYALAYSPDGRRVASVAEDGLTLIWDVTGHVRDGKLQALKPTAKELENLWRDLASASGAAPHKALWTLVAGAAVALPFLEEKLKPVPVDPKHIDKLIADLDSDQFAARQRSVTALEELAEIAEKPLQQALKNKPPLEVRQRIEKLLAKVEKERFALNPHRLRILRLTEALEQIGTDEASKVLEILAAGPPELRLTDAVKHEARACLERLGRR